MMQFTIRRARPQEAQALGAIACDAKASWGYSPSQIALWHDELVPTADSIGMRPTFVAERGDSVVAGFCQLVLGHPEAELEHLWVRPEFMGNGVGRALLAHAARFLASKGIAALAIDSEPRAEPFYLAQGAVRVGARAAPIDGDPLRVRPQLRLATGRG